MPSVFIICTSFSFGLKSFRDEKPINFCLFFFWCVRKLFSKIVPNFCQLIFDLRVWYLRALRPIFYQQRPKLYLGCTTLKVIYCTVWIYPYVGVPNKHNNVRLLFFERKIQLTHYFYLHCINNQKISLTRHFHQYKRTTI